MSLRSLYTGDVNVTTSHFQTKAENKPFFFSPSSVISLCKVFSTVFPLRNLMGNLRRFVIIFFPLKKYEAVHDCYDSCTIKLLSRAGFA